MEDDKIVENTNVTDDDKEVTEDDLRSLKYPESGVEDSQESDETEETDEDEQESEETDSEDSEETEETESDEESEFVKELPNIKGDTLEEYARNLEQTILESNREGKRLADKLKELEARIDTKSETEETKESGPVDPRLLYLDKIVNEDINKTFNEFQKKYPQTQDSSEMDKFTAETAKLQAYFVSQGQVLTAKELYPKVAAILGWEAGDTIDGKESLKIALKNKVATSKNSSSKPKATKKSKVTDAMIIANRLMYPDKTDAEIREELEPYIQ